MLDVDTMGTPAITVGKRLRALREQRGLNQSELATRVGSTPGYINKLEAGNIKRPSAERLTVIATALGVKLTDLTEPPAEVPPALLDALAAMDEGDRALVADVVEETRGLGPDERASALRFAVQAVRAIRAARPR